MVCTAYHNQGQFPFIWAGIGLMSVNYFEVSLNKGKTKLCY